MNTVPPPAYDQNQSNQPQPGYAMPMGNPVMMFGDVPTPVMCPNCQRQVVSRVEKKSGVLTWLICLGIAFLGSPLGCFLGCCLIPFCIDSGKDTHHYCPNCATLLGVRKAM